MTLQTQTWTFCVPETLAPRAINRLIAGDAIYRNGDALFKGETSLSFERVSTSEGGEQIIEAMECLSDYSDPCPFHEWVSYGLDETAGSMVVVKNGNAICGFVVFSVRLETLTSSGIDRIGLFVDLERIYVGATQRSKGYGKALLAIVADAVRQALLPLGSTTGRIPNIRLMTMLITGDTLCAAGDRLMKICLGAVEKQVFPLLCAGKLAEFDVQDMTASLHEDED